MQNMNEVGGLLGGEPSKGIQLRVAGSRTTEWQCDAVCHFPVLAADTSMTHKQQTQNEEALQWL